MYKSPALSLILGLFACEVAGAAEPAAADCANNECVVFVNDKPPAAEELCDAAAVTIRWTIGTDVVLTTCEDAGTEEQNTNFVSDVAGNRARKLVYGRPVLKEFLREHPAGPVPDKFAPRPYCTPVSLQKVSNSTFVLLDKLPANTENGYCFEPTYVTYDNGQITIDTAKARIDVSNKSYFGTLPTAQQQSSLSALVRQYGPGSRRPANVGEVWPPQENTRRIGAERAYLYGSPDDNEKRMGYLIDGDSVVVLEEAGTWTKIRYRQASGNEIIRWIRSADLAGKP